MSALVPFTFGPQFQDTMLALMMRDIGFTEKCLRYVPDDHLHSEAHRWLFDEIRRKYKDSGTIPSAPEIEENLRKVERHKRRMYKTFADKVAKIAPGDPDFIRDRLADFAKRTNFADLYAHGQTLYNAGRVDEAYRYVMEAANHIHAITFKDDQTFDISEFEGKRRRFLSQRKLTNDRMPTGIKPLDAILRGGLSRLEGEMAIILAEPKKGKTVALIHMGVAALRMRVGRVAHFILEGAEETTMFRYQSALSGIPEERISSDDLTPDEEERLHRISARYMNRLELVPFNEHWEYSTNDLDAKLSDLDRQGKTPDLCVLDYADLVQPREKTREERNNQRNTYRELKRICLMRKMAMWTASQAVRPKDAPQKEGILHGSDISETFEKVRIADFLCSLNQTPREKEMGLMRLHADIYRNNSCDRTIRLITDFERMIFHKPKFGHIDPRDIPLWMKSGKSRR